MPKCVRCGKVEVPNEGELCPDCQTEAWKEEVKLWEKELEEVEGFYVVLYKVDGSVDYEVYKDLHTAMRRAEKLARCINVDEVVVIQGICSF